MMRMRVPVVKSLFGGYAIHVHVHSPQKPMHLQDKTCTDRLGLCSPVTTMLLLFPDALGEYQFGQVAPLMAGTLARCSVRPKEHCCHPTPW